MTTAQIRAIEKHGQNLLAIFPKATEADPLELCRKLRRLEGRAAALALRLCNGPAFKPGEDEKIGARLLKAVNELLGNEGEVPVFINLDPRGYALKIRDDWMRENMKKKGHRASAILALRRDWGGYGLLAPEIDKDGN
jgi:hypothetical protein